MKNVNYAASENISTLPMDMQELINLNPFFNLIQTLRRYFNRFDQNRIYNKYQEIKQQYTRNNAQAYDVETHYEKCC